MDAKRRLITILAGLVLALSLLNFTVMIILAPTSITPITGKATSTQGNVSICIDAPPLITAIADQAVTVGTAFTLQVTASDGDDSTLAYYDDTALFDINQSGYISFTPTSSQVGTSTVLITVEDDTGCLAHNSTDDFILTISAAGTGGGAGGGAPAGGGEGGGGGGAAAKEAIAPPPEPFLSFDVSEKKVKVILKQSQSAEKTITIINYGNVELAMNVETPFTEVDVSPESFTLSPGEEQDITLLFNPSQDAEPNIYTGALAIRGVHGGEQRARTIALILEVESERILFDGSIDLSKKVYLPGEEIDYTVTISGLLPGTVTAVYVLSDIDGKIIFTEEETLPIKEQVSFSKSAPLPADLPSGQYVLALKMKAGESFATATELFTVEAAPTALAGFAAPLLRRPALVSMLSLAVFASIILIGIIVYGLHRKIKRKTFVRERVHERLVQRTVVKPKLIDTSALERKMQLLKESYQRGFIKEESYRQARTRLEELRERMRK